MSLAEAILRKSHESRSTQEEFFAANVAAVEACARAMAAAFDGGGRMFVMGNGGSACDAAHIAVEFSHPIVEKRPALPALALGNDVALLTAVANDQEFALAFAQQIRLLGRPGDIAMGISTSGKSASVVRGLQAAREVGMLTVGLGGRDGGRLPAICDHALVVRSYSIHRVQEVHTALLHVLWDAIHVIRGQDDVL
jgi:D-sedoheptulose 7-phosphate isomerase